MAVEVQSRRTAATAADRTHLDRVLSTIFEFYILQPEGSTHLTFASGVG
jgi:hypothetical protein